MKALKLTLFAGALSLAFVSCKKDDKEPTRSELLVSKAWKLSDVGEDTNRNGVLDASESEIDNCQKDDSYTFVSGGTGTFDEGASKCDPLDPQSYSFNWQLTDNETKITVTVQGLPELAGAAIKQLDNSNLVISQDFGGVAYISVLKR
jgi:hypothetical protein